MHIKPFIKKAKKRKVDIQLALLNIRATPIDGNLHSPGELLFGIPLTELVPHKSEPVHQNSRDAGINVSRMSKRNMIKLHITTLLCTQNKSE